MAFNGSYPGKQRCENRFTTMDRLHILASAKSVLLGCTYVQGHPGSQGGLDGDHTPCLTAGMI